MASRTRGAWIRPWLKRFWMSSALVRPEQRHAMVDDGGDSEGSRETVIVKKLK
jgi:hypothetical protein